jgi:hypothetical protein
MGYRLWLRHLVFDNICIARNCFFFGQQLILGHSLRLPNW